MTPITCTDEMYQAFIEATNLAGNGSETVMDLVKNGIEAALAAMPVEPVAWAEFEALVTLKPGQRCYAFGDNPRGDLAPLFTHPPMSSGSTADGLA